MWKRDDSGRDWAGWKDGVVVCHGRARLGPIASQYPLHLIICILCCMLVYFPYAFDSEWLFIIYIFYIFSHQKQNASIVSWALSERDYTIFSPSVNKSKTIQPHNMSISQLQSFRKHVIGSRQTREDSSVISLNKNRTLAHATMGTC